MLWKKKSPAMLFTLAVALSSATAYAIPNKPIYNSSLVTIPDLRPGFEFSITGLALKPGASNLNYVIFNKELPAQSPTWTENEIQPNYGGAFELGARYIFPQGSDVNLTWTHLYSSTSATTVAPNASFFLGPDFEIGPAALPIRQAVGNAQFKYDVANLDVGQYVNFGRHISLRFFGGLSTAFLREQVKTTYSGTVITGAFPGPFSTTQEVTANFSGAGPRFGIDGNVDVGCGFGFLGEAAASAIIGTSYSKTAYISSSAELLALFGQTSNSQFIKDQSVTQVIPGFDAKLGASYKYAFSNDMFLTIKAGYQAAVYVNAISQYLPASLVTPMDTGGIFVATMSHTLSNYSVQGPFLEATLQI